MRTLQWNLRTTVAGFACIAGVALGCDGSALGPGQAVADAQAPEAEPEPTPEEVAAPPIDDTVHAANVPLGTVSPSLRALPSGRTEGTTLVVEKRALAGRFLFGMGADPDGFVANLGGGSAGLTPLRVAVVLVPDPVEGAVGAGAFEIRVLDADAQPLAGADGLIESYPYSDVDADTIRVDFASSPTALELAVYGSCVMTRSAYALKAPPVYDAGLMTWPAEETYKRSGACQWVPRSASGLHVHYLRHDLAGRGFVPRKLVSDAPFGFFLAGDERESTLARLPGIAADEPAQTHTYYLVGFPDEMVPFAEQTFEAWNDALEEVTGRRPFASAPAPADMIPWDPRFHTVVWSDTGGGGAVAPFTNDPETGEIFQSLVVMWFGELDDLVGTYQDFLGEHPDVAEALLPTPGRGDASMPAALPAFDGFDPADLRDPLSALPRLGIAKPVRPAGLAARTLTTRPFVRRPLGPTDVRAALARDYADDEVKSVIVIDFLLHELGHNLGLRHNFIASVDKHRHSPAHSSSSTMDYVIGMLDPGSYDRAAMRHGYGASRDKSEVFLYCTDETMELEPACIQWDYGHPIRYELDLVDAYFAAYPPATADDVIKDALWQIDPELNRARSFINSDYERWDETEVATFAELLADVDCGPECAVHPGLRSALALYLLYSRHQVTAWWEPGYPDIWLDFPALTDTQAALLMDTFYEIVVTRDEPLALRMAIIGKLNSSAVSGASELLTALRQHYLTAPALAGDEPAVKAAIDDAFAAL